MYIPELVWQELARYKQDGFVLLFEEIDELRCLQEYELESAGGQGFRYDFPPPTWIFYLAEIWVFQIQFDSFGYGFFDFVVLFGFSFVENLRRRAD